MKRLLLSLPLLLTLWLPLTTRLPAMAAPEPDPRVADVVWAQLAEEDEADVLLLLPQADLSPAYALPDKTARGQWVVDALRQQAIATQQPLLAELDRMGVPYQPFWVVNAVRAHVRIRQLNRLLHFDAVQRVTPNTSFRSVRPLPAPMPQTTAETSPWGVQRVEAPWAWAQGVTGQGVVIAGQDTGYDWAHETLKRAYRGYDAAADTVSHDYNWHDAIHAIDPNNRGDNPCGLDSPEPCDDVGHGTHTMGTMVGNDLAPDAMGWPESAAHPIGVAPGARWIGCRNMERGWGMPSTYIECFQWFVAPWPVGGDPFTDGDPTKAPDIINNSWSCPASEGCKPENLQAIEPALNAADAAGILVVASAQNSGDACSTIRDPIAIYPKAFTVGATDSNDNLAFFSSRGPVQYDGETRIGPDISAPGVNIYSSLPNNRYGFSSGTSMASPHAAGVAALLLSARPELKGHPEQIRAELMARADHRTSSQGCGDDTPTSVPNNGYGWGIVNARNVLLPNRLFTPWTIYAANNQTMP
ncbi:MAG TPA: peptidase S8 [Caldilineales bacterium]|nr:peptidase S8 [Caldilineales bacterium]